MATLLLRDVMRGNPAALDARRTIQDAANLMGRMDIRHLIVLTPAGKPIGVVSQRDIFRHLAGTDLSPREFMIEDAMSAPLKWGPPDMHVPHAVKRILAERIGCLAVVDGEKLVGIVTRSDLLAYASWNVLDPDQLSAGHRVKMPNGEAGTVVGIHGGMARVQLDSSLRKSIAKVRLKLITIEGNDQACEQQGQESFI